MKAQEIEQMLLSLDRIESTQIVKIVFNEKTGIIGFNRLAGLIANCSNINLMDNGEEILLCAVCEGGWGSSAVANRTFAVRGFRNASDDILREFLKDVDSVEVVDNKMKQLLSGRQKRRDEFAQEIFKEVLTDEFLQEMENWEVCIQYGQSASQGTTRMSLRFRIAYDDRNFAKIVIDAFSGRIFANDWSIGCFENATQIQGQIRMEVERFFEQLTS